MFPLSSSSKFLFSPILVYDQGAHLWVFDLTGRKEQEEQTPSVIVPRLQEIERDGGRTRDKWGVGGGGPAAETFPVHKACVGQCKLSNPVFPKLGTSL